METFTIDLSTVLFHLFVYYVCFNLITMCDDDFLKSKKTIKKILNPFRDFKKDYASTFFLIMIIAIIPYLLIIWIDYLISTIKLNIIW